MMRSILLLAGLLLLASCATTEDKARAYFKKGAVKGVEPFDTLMERMNKDRTLRDIMYGQVKASYIFQCTVLRNQLYVASLKGASKEIEDATKLMESGYQEDDAAFLNACDQIMATPIGKTFVAIQQEYRAK